MIDHRTTDFIKNAVNPQWKESLLLWVPCAAQVDFPPAVRIHLFDKDMKMKDELIVSVVIQLQDDRGEVELHPMPVSDSPELSISFGYHASPMLFSDGMGDFDSPRRGSVTPSGGESARRGSRELTPRRGSREEDVPEESS